MKLIELDQDDFIGYRHFQKFSKTILHEEINSILLKQFDTLVGKHEDFKNFNKSNLFFIFYYYQKKNIANNNKI